jgi:hypothetical protein
MKLLNITWSEKDFAFEFDGYHFRGLTISQGRNGWNIVIRALDRQGQPVYAIAVSDDITEGLDGLLGALSGRGGASLWRFDRYAKMRDR